MRSADISVIGLDTAYRTTFIVGVRERFAGSRGVRR
jgi:hypothetical protein